MSPRLPTGVRRTASGFYEARWYDAAGRRHSACFDSAAEADAYRQEMLRTRRRGGSGDPSGGKMTVAEWMERWMAGRQIRSSYRTSELSRSRTHIIPAWGERRLADIRPSDIAAWVAGLAASGLAPASVRTCRRQLASCLRAAVNEGLIVTNPADATRPPQVARQEARFLTPDELVQLERAMDPWWSLIVPFAVDTGLRIGELAALRVSDVDLLRGRVRVLATATGVTRTVSGSEHRRQVGPPKTAAGRRVVPTLTRSTGERVAALIAERGLGRDDWLWSGRRGAPMDPNVFRARIWHPAVERAGLAEPTPTPHSLRHTAVALWVAAGMTDPLRLSRWLGHTSATVTWDVYGHLLGGNDDAGVATEMSRIRADAERRMEMGAVHAIRSSG